MIPIIDCCGSAGYGLPWKNWTDCYRSRDADGMPSTPKGLRYVFLYSIKLQPEKDHGYWQGYIDGKRYTHVDSDVIGYPVCIDGFTTGGEQQSSITNPATFACPVCGMVIAECHCGYVPRVDWNAVHTQILRVWREAGLTVPES